MAPINTSTRHPGFGSSHGTLILLNVLGINFVGDGLRDALDPYSAKHV